MSSSDSIEASAATIDQAIGQALAQLGAEQDDVTIEVLSTPRSGVLGIGARPARVRVTRRAPASARSGVMSPPPAPPLRATPPEMRRSEARPEARIPPSQPQQEPSEPTGDDRREQGGEPPRGEREIARPPRDAPPPRPNRRDVPRPERSGPPRQGRSEPPREDSRGQSRTPPEAPAREKRPERGEFQGRGRSENQGREPGEIQGGERSESSRGDRGAPANAAPRTSRPEGRGTATRDARDDGDARDDQRNNGGSEEAPRSNRGRSGGPPGGAAGSPAGSSTEGREPRGRRAPETQPQRAAEPDDHNLERDDDRDPFASVDEAGNDSRKIADLQEQAREATIFLERILNLMGEQAVIEPAETDDPETLELNIKGDGSGILIGRHGQTLDAIEYMVNRLLARKIKDAAPISIDTESYRARRRRLLQRMALSKGEQAKREHIAVTLDPMPPRDRRIVHLALKDDPMIATRSTGEGFMRAIEILPVDERRDPNERGNENRGRGRRRARESDQDSEPVGEQGGFKHGQKRIV